jgi:CBS domain-containing protein
MHIRDLLLERLAVKTVNDKQTVGEALKTIIESGYRSVPVVDANDMYKGMIYKVHLIEYLYEEKGDESAPIDSLIKHQDISITERASFLSALVGIKALPFLSVVENGKLIGVLTHNKVESVLEDAFGLTTGGINITLSSTEAKGMIEKLGKTLRHENIEGMFTLDNGSVLARRVVITLQSGKSDEEVDRLVEKLEKGGFRILQIEKLDKRD